MSDKLGSRCGNWGLALVFGFVLLSVGAPTESLGQSRRQGYRDPILTNNPRRDAGGSCVYDRDGKLVFAPDGKHCPDRSDHLSKPGETGSRVLASYPPALREDLARLLSDHDHLAGEVARLRAAIDSGKHAIALQAADKIRSELTDHRAREERFFETLSPRGSEP